MNNMDKLVPGNYPPEYSMTVYKKDCPRHEFTNYFKIILATDLRRFTETMEDLRNPKVMGSFLSKFFDESAEILQQRGGFMNKYLGDGFLVHFSVDHPENLHENLHMVMQALFNMHFNVFNQLKETHRFTKLGLSTVLSLEAKLPMGQIGKIVYTDYSMIGKRVNSTFRALDAAKGNLILIFEQLVEFLDDKWILVDIGTQSYDGIYSPIKLYSVLRPRIDKEVESGFNNACSRSCRQYSNCNQAWQMGNKGQPMINCHDCYANGNYMCWHWKECKIKFHYGREHGSHKGFQCCHICPHFKGCFHSYFLGKNHHPMISCELIVNNIQ